MKTLNASKRTKKTKVGDIPVDWSVVKLEKIAKIQTGIAKNSNKVRNTIELPYLRVANVQDGFLDLTEIKTIQVSKDKINRYKLEFGDVLLTEGGDFDKLGRGTVWCGEIKNCVHQNHVFAARPNQEIILSTFLSALTGSFYGKKYFLSCSKQSTNLASINSTQLKAFPVILPPLSEQKAIADLLSTWDEAIEKTERLVEAKEKRFRGLLQKLISEPRKTRKNTEWKRVKLGDVGNAYSGLSGKNRTHFGKGKPYLPYLNIYQNFKIDIKYLDYVDIDLKETQNLVRRGDVFFTVSSETPNEVGISSVLLDEIGECYLNSFCFGWRPTSEVVISDYLQFYFRCSIFRRQLKKLAQGATRFNLSKTELMKTILLLPPLNVQNQIANTLSTAQHEIDLLKKLLEKYKIQKRGLMQKMLTGVWRVCVSKGGGMEGLDG